MSTYCVPVRAVSCCISVSDLRHRSHDCAVGDVVCTLTNRTGSAPLSKRMVPAGMAEALDGNSASAGCCNGCADHRPLPYPLPDDALTAYGR